jgi:hypothetical protein
VIAESFEELVVRIRYTGRCRQTRAAGDPGRVRSGVTEATVEVNDVRPAGQDAGNEPPRAVLGGVRTSP